MATPKLSAEERAKVFKALSDPRRLDIVDLLAAEGSQCGTELADKLGVSIALLCHHWDVLVEAGLVKKERVGQLRVCTLDEARLRETTGSWARASKPRAKKQVRKPHAKKRASKA